jgi:two-component system alkaline phosphatase synthesis response regulator PhoP
MSENKTAIIVEDDDHISYLLNFLLQKEGYTVSVASDGEMAMAMINKDAPPKVMILDVMLPFHSGFELLKHLRAKPDWKDVPVLMLTAKSQEQDIVRALDNGANDYLIKPFQPMELLARVKRIVKIA